MDQSALRNILMAVDSTISEETVQIALEAQNNPEAARLLWHLLLSLAVKDERFGLVFKILLESVLVDHITSRMDQDEDYTLVISRRITDLIEQMLASRQSRLTNAA